MIDRMAPFDDQEGQKTLPNGRAGPSAADCYLQGSLDGASA